MKNKYSLLIYLFLLLSCGKITPNPYCENTQTVGSEDNFVMLYANELLSGDSLPHINDIIIVDSLLIADVDDNNARIQLFTLDGERAGKFGKTGHAIDEYTGGMSFVVEPDDKFLYIKDVNKGLFAVFNADSIKDSGKIMPVRIVNTFPGLFNVFLSGESELIYEHEIPGTYALTSRDIQTKKGNWDEVLYQTTDNPFSKYHSYMAYNDDKDIIVAAMRYANQVNFMNLKTKDRKSVIVKSKKSIENDSEGFEYYCNIAANENNVFALFMNQSAEESYDVSKPMEIHSFDWEGNFIEKYKVSEYILRIAVDNKGNLYGKDLLGNVYKYLTHNPKSLSS